MNTRFTLPIKKIYEKNTSYTQESIQLIYGFVQIFVNLELKNEFSFHCLILMVEELHFSNFSGEPKNKFSQKPF
jgi:hypothetical protein